MIIKKNLTILTSNKYFKFFALIKSRFQSLAIKLTKTCQTKVIKNKNKTKKFQSMIDMSDMTRNKLILG